MTCSLMSHCADNDPYSSMHKTSLPRSMENTPCKKTLNHTHRLCLLHDLSVSVSASVCLPMARYPTRSICPSTSHNALNVQRILHDICTLGPGLLPLDALVTAQARKKTASLLLLQPTHRRVARLQVRVVEPERPIIKQQEPTSHDSSPEH